MVYFPVVRTSRLVCLMRLNFEQDGPTDKGGDSVFAVMLEEFS